MFVMIFHIDGILHTLNCAFVGTDDTFIFQATSSNSVNTQVFKERILTAICDLDDRTFGQNSKLQVDVQQIVANFGHHQGSSSFVDSGPFYDFFGDLFSNVLLFTPTYASSCPIEV